MKRLKNAVSELANDALVVGGFHRKGPLHYERDNDGLTQGIEFIKHRDRFTANSYWSILATPLGRDGSFQFSKRVGRFAGETDKWFAFDDELDEGISFIAQALSTSVLPFFDS